MTARHVGCLPKTRLIVFAVNSVIAFDYFTPAKQFTCSVRSSTRQTQLFDCGQLFIDRRIDALWSYGPYLQSVEFVHCRLQV